jgi:hypothetical protein
VSADVLQQTLCLKMINTNYGHYTSPKGLLGIVQRETLWATNIKFLNDEEEFQHTLNLIRDIMSEGVITNGYDNFSLHKNYIDDIESNLKSLDSYESNSVYTLSFSEETDLLSQWRGYCPSNNGYCIEFDINYIYNSSKQVHEKINLVACVYDDIDKRNKIIKLLGINWNNYFSSSNKIERDFVIENLVEEIVLTASYFKHSSFSEEKEHRIIVMEGYKVHENIMFREGRSSLIPYVQIPAPRSSINKIRIGPTENKELSERAMKTFLSNQFGEPLLFNGVKIEHSKTPYRPW